MAQAQAQVARAVAVWGAGGAGGAVPPLPCTPDALPGALADARWDTRFTVAGVAGPDGDAPHVADFARDLDGTVLATGRFRWLGAERVEPLLRAAPGQASAGVWAPARDTWEIAPPEFGGFSSVAVGPAGELALATTGLSPQIWIDSGAGLQAIAQLNAASDAFDYVRSMAWYDGALWVAGWFTLTNGVSNLAVWDGVEWTQAPNGIIDGPVYDLLVDGQTTLVAAGTLWRGEFPPQERMVLRFDGTRFDWLAGGVAANFVSDAAVTAEGLWFAGAIAETGVGADRVSTVGIARLGWPR
ncbi:MAG: hypothetical protein WKG00_21640 [Polyangiaceae bacterium]